MSGERALSLSPVVFLRKISTSYIKQQLPRIATAARSQTELQGSTPDPCDGSPQRAYRQSLWSSSRAARERKSQANDVPLFREAGRSPSTAGPPQSLLSGVGSTLSVLASDGISEVLVDSADLAALLRSRDMYDNLHGMVWYFLKHVGGVSEIYYNSSLSPQQALLAISSYAVVGKQIKISFAAIATTACLCGSCPCQSISPHDVPASPDA